MLVPEAVSEIRQGPTQMAPSMEQRLAELLEARRTDLAKGSNSVLATLSQSRADRIRSLLSVLPDASLTDLYALAGNTPDSLASVLRSAFSEADYRARLDRLAITGETEDAVLDYVSLTGGGCRLRKGSGGVVLTGPGAVTRIVEAFPELLPLSLVLGYYEAPALGDEIGFSNPETFASANLRFDLSAIKRQWTITAASAFYTVRDFPNYSNGEVFIADPFGGSIQNGSGQAVPWSGLGMKWIIDNAGNTGVSPGLWGAGISGHPPPLNPPWNVPLGPLYLQIWFEETGGDACPSRADGVLLLDVPFPGTCARCEDQNLGGGAPGSAGAWGLPIG